MRGMRIITDARCTVYHAPGHPERPARITATLEKLRAQKDLALEWTGPDLAADEVILRAHSPAHLARLNQARDFDADTACFPTSPNTPGDPGRSLALQTARAGQMVLV